MLIATAGHVDHGKSVLVRALTGVDTDRLPEERRRGLTIDLGFAYRDAGEGRILGFVDVPGHERFVRNMLAGVGAIDLALLVVAADDGPMPQTREHLAILDLLEIPRAAVALTKIDRVGTERLAEARAEVAALLAPTRLAGARVFPVDGPARTGIDALEEHLLEEARSLPARTLEGGFRLAVDRAFVLPGTGLVVTGAAVSGEVASGDRLRLVPGDLEVRVRGIHAQDRRASKGRAGERLAINLSGVEREQIHRGQWLVSPYAVSASRRLGVRLRLLPEAKTLRHWSAVHVHLGAAFSPGRAALLDTVALEPGASAWGEIELDRAMHASYGDRFVLRDASGQHTLGGGQVIDPLPLERRRGRARRATRLAAQADPDPARALARLLAESSEGVDPDPFVQGRNLLPAQSAACLAAAGAVPVEVAGRSLMVDPTAWEALEEAVLDTVDEHHREHPEEVGPDGASLRRMLGPAASTALVTAALGALAGRGALVRQGARVRRPHHQPRLRPEERRLLDDLTAHLDADTLRPPPLSELAARLGYERPALATALDALSRHGHLVRVAPNRWFHPAALERLATIAAELDAAGGGFDAATFRDASGIGRNLTIEVLEHFDRAGLTRRVRDRRRLSPTPGTSR